MAGRMISELSDATTLQNTDLIPLARGATTLKVSGLTLASSLSTTMAPGLTALMPTTAGATGGGSDRIFWENDQTVTTNYTVTNGKNALTAGPITVAAGVTVTVPAGSVWTVV